MLFIVRDDRALRLYFIGRGLQLGECGFPYFGQDLDDRQKYATEIESS